MSGEWCDTDPHLQLVAGRGEPIPVQVVISCPSRAEAQAAHRDVELTADLVNDGDNTFVYIFASNIASPYRLKAFAKKFDAEASAPEAGDVFEPGELGTVALPLPGGAP
jgi:hypothetical protein